MYGFARLTGTSRKTLKADFTGRIMITFGAWREPIKIIHAKI